MKQFTVFFLIVVFCLTAIGCLNQNHHTTDLSSYGDWEDKTIDILASNFLYELPDKALVDKNGYAYYYKSSQGILGDKNFVILVVLKYPNTAEYNKALNQYIDFPASVFTEGDTTHYLIQASPESGQEYLDENTYDGMFYDFEVISFDQSNQTISFLSAHVWDYYKDEKLSDYLRKIYPE